MGAKMMRRVCNKHLVVSFMKRETALGSDRFVQLGFCLSGLTK